MKRLLPIVLVFLIAPISHSATPADQISVSLDRTRPKRGEVVEVRIQSPVAVHAVLLTPTVGVKNLQLAPVAGQQNTFHAKVAIGNSDPEGLYVYMRGPATQLNQRQSVKRHSCWGGSLTIFLSPHISTPQNRRQTCNRISKTFDPSAETSLSLTTSSPRGKPFIPQKLLAPTSLQDPLMTLLK